MRKCGTTGTFEYERVHEAFDDHVRFISLSSGSMNRHHNLGIGHTAGRP